MQAKQITSGTFMMNLSFVILLIISTSCTGGENSQQEDQSSQQTSQKVEKPSMDIFAAVFMGNIKAIQQHIDLGTDLNGKDAYGSTPLNIATTFGKTEVALLLIKAGADLNATNADGSTPLHTAAFYCRTEIAEALSEKGVDKSLKNQYGSTALESVLGPFEAVKPIYQQIAKDLGPLGLRLDLERIELTRPTIAEMISK